MERYPRESLCKRLEANLDEHYADKKIVSFTAGLMKTTFANIALVAGAVADSYERLANRIATTDQLVEDTDKRIADMEKRVAALEKDKGR